MALSPIQKTRKSPRLASSKKTGSKAQTNSNSVAETSPKLSSVNKQLFDNGPSTPLISKKKLSLPKKEVNECFTNETVLKVRTAKNDNTDGSVAAGANSMVVKSNASSKKNQKDDSFSPSKFAHNSTNGSPHLTPKSCKQIRSFSKVKCSGKFQSETVASPKQSRVDAKVTVRVLGFDLNKALNEDHALPTHNTELPSPQKISKSKKQPRVGERVQGSVVGLDLSNQLQEGHKLATDNTRNVASPEGDSKRKSSGSDGVSKRRKSPGIRVVGGRIYDSENGKTCHQCRQKTLEIMAPCKNVVGTKACTQKFCPKCLLNRYGEKVEEAVKSAEWKCPRCRGSCNCSICMKKQGRAPTGILVHAAKATGFASVADLLRCDDSTLVGALNGDAVNSLMDSLRSGNLDVKDLVKKLRPVKSSMNSKEANGNCLVQEGGSPAVVSPSKTSKLKKSLDKSSASSEYSHSESKASELERATMNSKITRNINAKDVNPVLDVNDQTVGTKKNSKRKSKVKVESDLPNEGLCKGKIDVDIGKHREKKSCGPPFFSIAKSPIVKIKGIALHKSEDFKDFHGVCTDAEPLQRQKVTKLKQELEQAHPFETCSNEGKVKPIESGQVTKASAKQAKKRKSESTIASADNDAIKGNEQQSIIPNGSITGVTKEHARRRKKSKQILETEEIVLPQGEPMTFVAGIEFPADDVGSALQFLEFCSAFEQASTLYFSYLCSQHYLWLIKLQKGLTLVLELNKGQPEAILRELMRGRIGRRGLYSSVVQFHVKLLSLIGEDNGKQCTISLSGSGENSWLQVLKRLVMKITSCSTKEDSLSSLGEQQKLRLEVSQLDNLTVSTLKGGPEGYDKLDPSRKLRLLNILCDESLSTDRLRNWVESARTKFNELKKEYQEEVMAAKEKVKEAKQKMKDEVARILLSAKDGAMLTIDEHEQLVLKVKHETEKACAAEVDLLEAASRMKKQRWDAVRTEPIVWDKSGQAYWRLKGGSDRSVVLVQGISNWEPLVGQEQWSVYTEEEENVLARYISTLRLATCIKIVC
eukprot:Gb_14005 [translate_table: standard]